MHEPQSKPGRAGAGDDVILSVEDLAVHFPVGGGLRGRRLLRAVDGVDLTLKRGECLGLVGESGSGKSTVALSILGLQAPTRGRVVLDGQVVTGRPSGDRKALARIVQMVFQDPYASLNPRQTVRRTLEDPLRLHGVTARSEIEGRVAEMLGHVGLRPEQADRYPHEFSGGQRQRIGIARALILNPRIVICDEPVSALDVSIRAQIINLLLELQRRAERGLRIQSWRLEHASGGHHHASEQSHHDTHAARTLASALGDVTSLQWARPPAGDGARTPERAEPLIRSGANELRLRRPIDELVADGDRVALRVCGDVVESWHVTTGVRVELLPTWAPPPHTHYACESELGQLLENPCHYTRDLALSDLGLAFLFGDGCAGRFWDLDLQVTPGVDLVKLAWTDGWGGAGPRGLGWTRGSGNLLVFSDLHTIWRVRPPGFPGACPTMPWQSSGTAPGPCQRLTTEPGRWVPYAVDGSRIVAAGDDAVVLLDGDGHRLRSVTVHALAAALSGDELVVLTPGWIRDFNTDTGELEHSWPRPEVASGGCADVDHWWDTDDCLAPRVEGVDSARGLVAMAIDGRIHLIRLADGVDVVLAEGSVARFVSSGIVYASRARSNDPTYPWRLIHVPFEMLPLASADE